MSEQVKGQHCNIPLFTGSLEIKNLSSYRWCVSSTRRVDVLFRSLQRVASRYHAIPFCPTKYIDMHIFLQYQYKYKYVNWLQK